MRATSDVIDGAYALKLSQAALAVRSGRLTAEDFARACIARIRAREPQVNAWVWFDAERMIACAREADAQFRAGRATGALHGMPIGVKDIIDTRGIPTRMGSPVFEGNVPSESAQCILLLESAGGYVQGKTHTTEFAAQYPAPTANPWGTMCTPGGSSSGSAAAVACGFTPAALASQTRGSTIRPAAFCGVVGFKPSFGAISTRGVLEVSENLDHVGVIVRCVDDAALLFSQLASDAHRSLAPRTSHGVADCPPPNLAVIRTPWWNSASEDQRSLFGVNCASLEKRGARTAELALPQRFDRAADAIRTIQLYEISLNFRAIVNESRARISPAFLALCELGTAITAERYSDARGLVSLLRRDLADICAPFDAVLTLPAAGEAPRGLQSTGDAAFNSLWTACGLPCVTIPTGRGRMNMPMGLQIVGGFEEDWKTLRTAKWCETHLPFDQRPALT